MSSGACSYPSKQSRDTRAILLTTFLLTVVFDLTIAIGFGLLLAVFAFIKRMNDATQVSRITGSINMTDELESHSGDIKDEVLHLPQGWKYMKLKAFLLGVATSLMK